MTTTVFFDDFSGSGDLDGTTPDTTLDSKAWIAGPPPNGLTLSGGYVSPTDTSALDSFGYADLGADDYSENIGGGRHVAFTINFRTAATITTDVLNQIGVIFSVAIGGGGSGGAFGVQAQPSDPWSIQWNGEFIECDPPLAASTDYTAVLTLANGYQRLEVNGQTFELYDVFYGDTTGEVGINSIDLLIGQGAKVADITADAEDANEGYGEMAGLDCYAVGTYHGQYQDALMPAIEMTGSGHDSSLENMVDVLMPAIEGEARGGGNADGVLGALIFEGTGTIYNIGAHDALMPAIEGDATGTGMDVGIADAVMPMFEMIGYAGAVLDVILGAIEGEATGSVGALGSMIATLPMFELEATGSADDYGVLDALMPALESGPYGVMVGEMGMFTLTATGSAVVVAAYDAYSVNLRHEPERGVEPIDEVTRYTAFPFTRIVRWKGNYFGVAADGLYKLLVGTTDGDVDITWAVRTGITDFKSANKKTIESVYLGGRFANATVRLYTGETEAKAYAYSTPRSSEAQNYRVPMGRGIKARYFAVGATGAEEMDLDTLDFNVVELARKI